MIAFSTDDELMMGLTMVKDDTFRIFIKGKITRAIGYPEAVCQIHGDV